MTLCGIGDGGGGIWEEEGDAFDVARGGVGLMMLIHPLGISP